MARFSADHPEHPYNRSIKLHAALERILKPGSLLPMDVWIRCVRLATGVTTRRGTYEYTETMEDLGLIEWKKDLGVILKGPEARASLQQLRF